MPPCDDGRVRAPVVVRSEPSPRCGRCPTRPHPTAGRRPVLATGCAAATGTPGPATTGCGPFPTVPGHELAGVVVDVGAGVDRRRIGERVTVLLRVRVRTLRWCRAGDAPGLPQPAAAEGFTHQGLPSPGSSRCTPRTPTWWPPGPRRRRDRTAWAAGSPRRAALVGQARVRPRRGHRRRCGRGRAQRGHGRACPRAPGSSRWTAPGGPGQPRTSAPSTPCWPTALSTRPLPSPTLTGGDGHVPKRGGQTAAGRDLQPASAQPARPVGLLPGRPLAGADSPARLGS